MKSQRMHFFTSFRPYIFSIPGATGFSAHDCTATSVVPSGRTFVPSKYFALCCWQKRVFIPHGRVTTNTPVLSCVRGYTHSTRSGYHQYACVVLGPWLYTFHTVGLPPIRLCCPVSVAIHIPYGRVTTNTPVLSCVRGYTHSTRSGYHQYACVVLCPWLYTFHTVGLPPIRLCCPVSVAIHSTRSGYHQYACVVLCPWLYTFHTVGLPPIRLCCPVSVAIHIPHGRVTTNTPVLSCVRGYTHSIRSGYHQYACIVLCPWLYTFHTVGVTTNTPVLSCVRGYTHSIRSWLPPIRLCCPVSVAIHIPHGRVTTNTPVLSCVRGYTHSTRSGYHQYDCVVLCPWLYTFHTVRVTTNTTVLSCVRGYTHSIRSGLTPIRLCCPVSVAIHIPYGRGYHQYDCVVLYPWLCTFHTVGVTTNTPVLSCVRGYTHSIRSGLPPIRLCCPVSVAIHIPYSRGYHQYACVVLCPWLYTFHTVGVTTNTPVLSCVRGFIHSTRSGLPPIRLCCPVSVALYIPHGRGYHQYACVVLCPWLYTFHTVGVTTNTPVLSCVRGFTHSIRSG